MIGFALTVLNLAVSRSILSLGSRFQAYGVIGSVLVLTLWVWMVGVVIYFGQCWSVELAKASDQAWQGSEQIQPCLNAKKQRL